MEETLDLLIKGISRLADFVGYARNDNAISFIQMLYNNYAVI